MMGVICRKTGKAIAAKLNGHYCLCNSFAECPLNKEEKTSNLLKQLDSFGETECELLYHEAAAEIRAKDKEIERLGEQLKTAERVHNFNAAAAQRMTDEIERLRSLCESISQDNERLIKLQGERQGEGR